MKYLSDATVDKFNARLLAKRFSQNQGQDSDDKFALVVRFDSLGLLLSNVTVTGFVPQQLDVKATFLNAEIKEKLYM
jgi:hypothetical protein